MPATGPQDEASKKIPETDAIFENLKRVHVAASQETETLRISLDTKAKLLIDLDNRPEIGSSRTQFMKRLADFSDRNQLTLELAYYPPYHSKYNPIERCWGILENHWNGALLSSVEAAAGWAKTMTWRRVTPIVHLLDRVYETGARLTKSAFRPIASRLERSTSLPKWSLVIKPNSG